jgi:hypothetical protein
MDYKKYFGIGVAGNFTGHLEQANEAKDFEAVEVEEVNQPKAIFPFFMPNLKDSFLSIYPISDCEIKLPDTPFDIQIEPEVALICDVTYKDKKVVELIPRKFGAYNDCSIRRPDAKKISHKKNWGESSKGLSSELFDIDNFTKDGILENFSIASFHISKGVVHQYGETSDVSTYSYCYKKLIDWTIEKLNNQKDVGPAEEISNYLEGSNYPSSCIISIGATRYTTYGESNFLAKGDKSIVVVFDRREQSEASIKESIEASKFKLSGSSFLVQDVV